MKILRKIRTLAIIAVLLFAALRFAGCGKSSDTAAKPTPAPSKTEEQRIETPKPADKPQYDMHYYAGTWKVEKIIVGESIITIEDAVKYGMDESVREIAIVLCEDGRCFLEEKEGAWALTEKGINISGTILEIKDERILIPSDDYTVAFAKVSDSQELPEPASAEESEAETGEKSSSGIRPEFKEAMDSYEAFYDGYCEFMKKYMDNPTDFSLLAKYASMLTELDEMQKKFDAWSESDLSTEELQYYIEVSARIQQKMVGLL